VNDPHSCSPSSLQTQTIFQKVTGEVLAQRIEALALEIRGIVVADSLSLASTETLSTLAMTLNMILRRIDDIFEYDGFVFTPSCTILLELFQARTRGSFISATALLKTLNYATPVTLRWLDFLEGRNLLEQIRRGEEDHSVYLTEKGHLKVAQALQLLL
jgi:hypothetical protein